MLVLRAFHGRAKRPPLEADQGRILLIMFGFVIRPYERLAAAASEYQKTGVIIPGQKFLHGIGERIGSGNL